MLTEYHYQEYQRAFCPQTTGLRFLNTHITEYGGYNYSNTVENGCTVLLRSEQNQRPRIHVTVLFIDLVLLRW
jgi:hypothetical protein